MKFPNNQVLVEVTSHSATWRIYKCYSNCSIWVTYMCMYLAHVRKTFYSANNMKELFQYTEINNVKSFLKTVKLYTKI